MTWLPRECEGCGDEFIAPTEQTRCQRCLAGYECHILRHDGMTVGLCGQPENCEGKEQRDFWRGHETCPHCGHRLCRKCLSIAREMGAVTG